MRMAESAYGAVTREISRYMNANSAKLLALVLIFGLAAYHAAIRWRRGGDTTMCESLLTDGRFAGGHSLWQPSGCMLHYYTKKDFRMCVNDIAYWGGHTRIVLVGDSRMRQLFCALAAYADDDSQVGSSGTACPSSVRHLRGVGAEAPQAGVTGGPKASEGRGWPAEDLEYTSDKNQLRIEFRSRPTLDRLVQKEVSRFEDESVSERPTLVVLASGLAALLSPNASAAYSVHDTKLATELRENVTSLVHLVDRLPRTRAFWMLQDPVYDGRTWSNYSSLSNVRIDVLNEAMSASLYAAATTHVGASQSHSSVWSSARLVASELRLDDSIDGVHSGSRVAEWKRQQLLNAYCNARMHYSDSSCCRAVDQLTATQVATLLIFGTFALLWLILRFYLFGMRRRSKILREGYRPLTATAVDDTDDVSTHLTDLSSNLQSDQPQLRPSRNGLTCNDGESRDDSSARAASGKNSSGVGSAPNGHSKQPLDSSTQDSVTSMPTPRAAVNGQCRLSLPMPCTRLESCYIVLECLARFGVIIALCLVCDRLPVFMKENKVYTPVNLLLPLAYVLAIGLFFVDDSKLTAAMNRDVTDEWKGWLQLFILVSNLCGAFQDPIVYAAVRCAASAYLFLFAFCHFTVCITRPEQGGARRLFSVLFRLNFFSISLCFAMNRAYQFYTFTALVSFWFLLLHIVLFLLPPRLSYATSPNGLANEQLGNWFYVRFALKFVFLTGIVLLFSYSDVIFDNVFYNSPFRSLFTKSEDEFDSANALGTWKFRFLVDRFTVLAGCLFAFALQVLRRHGVLADNSHSNLFVKSRTNALVFAAGCAALAVYAFVTVISPVKQDLVRRHPYIVVLPIVGYAAVRNVLGSIRRRYSPMFAWVGRHSLELYVGSYHVWLAADGNGVLVLVRSNHVLNLLLSTFVFLCVAHESRRITTVLTPRLVPTDWRLLLIHLLVFIAVLVLPTALAHNIIRF